MTRCLLAIAALLVLATSCSDSETVPAEVVELFDRGNTIADLTEPGDEEVPRESLLEAANRARALGTELRIVVAAPDDELVSASAVVGLYGGTAISYIANDTPFEAASEDIDSDQVDRAVIPAGQSSDLGDSASAFVSLLEDEGIQEPSSSWWPSIAIVLVVLSAVFLLWQALRYRRSRKRRAKRRRDYLERQEVLRDWAERLMPEVERLEAAADQLDPVAQQTLRESREFADRAVGKVDEATSPSDLDAAEMRIGRHHMRLRDLRRELQGQLS